jgi:hypothetical protein
MNHHRFKFHTREVAGRITRCQAVTFLQLPALGIRFYRVAASAHTGSIPAFVVRGDLPQKAHNKPSGQSGGPGPSGRYQDSQVPGLMSAISGLEQAGCPRGAGIVASPSNAGSLPPLSFPFCDTWNPSVHIPFSCRKSHHGRYGIVLVTAVIIVLMVSSRERSLGRSTLSSCFCPYFGVPGA